MSFHVVNSRLVWLPESKRPKSGAALAIPSNDHLWMIAGPGLELKKAHGKELELEAVRQGPIEIGSVAVTSGEAIGFGHLFHVAVTGQDLQWVPGAGNKAAEALLDRAARSKIEDLLVYPFYRGTHAARPEAAREMLGGFLRVMERGITVKTVQVLVADAEEQRLLHDIFLQLLSGA